MIPIDPTPESLETLYAAMHDRIAAVRERLRRPLTLSEKLIFGHLADPAHAELTPGRSYVRLLPDRVVLQDVLGQTAMLQFQQTGLARVAIPSTIHCDHLIQARTGARSDLADACSENGEVYEFLRSAAARFGLGFWQAGAGIIHQVVLEQYAHPGALILGTDSHTPNAGGAGALAVGVGGADAVEAMAGLGWEVLLPRRIAVVLTGELHGWTAPKDVILWLAGQLGVSGATNCIVEYIGTGAKALSATGKATIANMGAELGATSSVFETDDAILRYLRATGRGGLAGVAMRNLELLAADADAVANPDRFYDHVVRLDLSSLEPQVAGPHSPDRVRSLSCLAAEVGSPVSNVPDSVSAALIGSCTNSSYQDMARAADVLRQAREHGIAPRSEFFLTPGSEQVRATLERDGILDAIADAGVTVLANACGPCIGQWHRRGGDEPNVIVTSFNRNFPKRNDGKPGTMNLIASPELVTAFALAGRLSFDPRVDALRTADGREVRLAPPAAAPEVPTEGFVLDRTSYLAPPDDGRGVVLAIDPASERLQALSPWPAWDGHDFEDLPLLMKTSGKTTTDHISPAGSWLRFRGHLERFSDNFLMGAVDAFRGSIGRVRDCEANENDVPVAKVARRFRSLGRRWVVVGDTNYGEGSSREHAALSPRLLGGAAVIARSFARIHESNLKKQGMLALTFANPGDYERVQEGDRLSLRGLSKLAPATPVVCELRHNDGTTEQIDLVHTYSREQLDWFRRGSSINALAGR